jgi:hypothetical protein
VSDPVLRRLSFLISQRDEAEVLAQIRLQQQFERLARLRRSA